MISMSLCIIGWGKTESNLMLLEEAKKRFGSVFFVPIDGIGIGLNEEFSISYRNSDILKFDAVFSRIPKKYYSYAYQLLSLFPKETYMPVKPISYLIAEERFFLLTVLRKRGVPTLNLHLARSSKAAYRIIEHANYPFIIRSPEKKTGIYVKKESEAKGIIDALTSINQPVLVEEHVNDMVSVFVAEPDILAALKKKSKEFDVVFGEGEMKKEKINKETEQLAIEAANAIEAQIVRVDISRNPEPRIVNIELNPSLVKASQISGVNLPEKIMEAVHNNYLLHKEKPMLIKFFEDAKSVVKDVLKSKQLL